MIDEEATLEEYGYTSNELSYGSGKRVVAICDDCGKRRDISFSAYRELCVRCSHLNMSNETRKRMSEAHSGENNSMYGKHHSKESRRRSSATKQGIHYDVWESYACESPYCPSFNYECKESNRDKYDRKCFICGLPESENVDSMGKQWRLSVHHVDMEKSQGCNGVRWKLVPVCIHCHGTLHTELWKARIVYLLNDAIECKTVSR